jgi:hypothetical protein
MNKYDLLAWWRKVLMSCETEDQFKNALNLWPKVRKLAPCVNDAWNVVVDAAKARFNISVPSSNLIFGVGRFSPMCKVDYPKTRVEIKSCVFGGSMPACKPPRKP